MQLGETTKKAIDNARIAAGATEAILFGSRARNDSGPDSDVDLCFLFPFFPADPLELMFLLRRTIHQTTNDALDIIVYEQSIFESKAAHAHTFEHRVRVEGISV